MIYGPRENEMKEVFVIEFGYWFYINFHVMLPNLRDTLFDLDFGVSVVYSVYIFLFIYNSYIIQTIPR